MAGPGRPVRRHLRRQPPDQAFLAAAGSRNGPGEFAPVLPVGRILRVDDVATGKLLSFAAPAGTPGWVPHRGGQDLWSFTGFPPSGRLLAAHAALAPAGRGIARTFVLRLTGSARRLSPVPSSDAFLLSAMAWSADGSLLFYQGPGAHLWAYRPATGRVWSSRTPCCDYEVLAPIDR